MTEEEARSTSAESIDVIARAIDGLTAPLDGADTIASTQLLARLIGDMGWTDNTLTQALAVVALRHRRAINAMATTAVIPDVAPQPAPAKASTSAWLAFSGAAVGGIIGGAVAIIAAVGALSALGIIQ